VLFLLAIDTLNLAVMEMENLAGERYLNEVRALPEMLITSLSQYPEFALIERSRIEKAYENFRIEMVGGIDPEAALKVGNWLGADAVLLGTFSIIEGKYRLDARIIDTHTGRVIVAAYSEGTKIGELPDTLAKRLREKYIEGKEVPEKGELEIYFMIDPGALSHGKAYHHIVRLYVDGVYYGTSPPVQKIKEWQKLFHLVLDGGKEYTLKLVHGYVEKGKWYDFFPDQPPEIKVKIEPGKTKVVKYRYHMSLVSNRYIFDEK